jgi:hypothetical protein
MVNHMQHKLYQKECGHRSQPKLGRVGQSSYFLKNIDKAIVVDQDSSLNEVKSKVSGNIVFQIFSLGSKTDIGGRRYDLFSDWLWLYCSYDQI